jgi:hypothetical protein
MVGTTTWDCHFHDWLAPFWAALGDARRRRWAPVYVRGLLGTSVRKSIGPLAADVAPRDYGQVHHFVNAATWDDGPLERVLAEKAEQLVGGPDAVLIVDDTAQLKQGRHSVGVGRQYAGAAGKKTNCQTLVSLTLARGEVPVALAPPAFPARGMDERSQTLHGGYPPWSTQLPESPDNSMRFLLLLKGYFETFGIGKDTPKSMLDPDKLRL